MGKLVATWSFEGDTMEQTLDADLEGEHEAWVHEVFGPVEVFYTEA